MFNKESKENISKSKALRKLIDKYNEQNKMKRISYEKWKAKSIFLKTFFKKKSFNKQQKIFSSIN